VTAIRFDVVTVLPELLSSYLAGGVLGRSIDEGIVAVGTVDLREHGVGKHRRIDDAPYGGGDGMVMMPGPAIDALTEARTRTEGPTHVVALGPAGRPFTRDVARRFAALPHLVLLCGRYEGLDERIYAHVDEEISLGDFVLTGGELAALAVIDATSRLIPGVLGNEGSAVHESFEGDRLEHPQYTRPREHDGATVPDVLLSGDHARIEAWRRDQALRRTIERRPDLLGPRAEWPAQWIEIAEELDASAAAV
jgi:tRNA (guanine37-N1)-methyltransferase